MTGLQALDVQFSRRSSTSDRSFWILQQLLQRSIYTSTSFRRLCFTKAVVLEDNLVKFACMQSMVQEILFADSLIVQHNGEATLTTEPAQSFWFHRAHSMEPPDRYVKVFITYL